MTGSNGQDWASYQSPDPAVTGLDFVFVKATEGTGYVNPRHAAQVAHARGSALVVGHYHYPHMANGPEAEADRFLAVANPQPGDLLVLDWEGYDEANKGVAFSRQVQFKAAFVNRIKAVAPTHRCIVYCSTDYLGRDPGGIYGDALWIATAGRPAGEPGISHEWLFHQYSTAGGIDHDYCPLTPAELHSWAHAEKDDDMALTQDDISKLADAVWKVRLISPTATDPKANTRYSGDFLRWGDQHTADLLTAIRTSNAATNAAIAALAAQLGKNVDTATVVAAVRQAIADTVVRVHVDVTGPGAGS